MTIPTFFDAAKSTKSWREFFQNFDTGNFRRLVDHARTHAISLGHFPPYKLHRGHACWQHCKHPAISNYPETRRATNRKYHRLLDEFAQESFGVSSKYQGNDCVYGGEARPELLSSRSDTNGRGDTLRLAGGSARNIPRDGHGLNCSDSTSASSRVLPPRGDSTRLDTRLGFTPLDSASPQRLFFPSFSLVRFFPRSRTFLRAVQPCYTRHLCDRRNL